MAPAMMSTTNAFLLSMGKFWRHSALSEPAGLTTALRQLYVTQDGNRHTLWHLMLCPSSHSGCSSASADDHDDACRCMASQVTLLDHFTLDTKHHIYPALCCSMYSTASCSANSKQSRTGFGTAQLRSLYKRCFDILR